MTIKQQDILSAVFSTPNTRSCRAFRGSVAIRVLCVAMTCIVGALLSWQECRAERIKDIASVRGVRDNQLVGYGLLVGLSGTGDGSNTAFTTHGLANMMQNMGMQIDRNTLKVKNVASVMITASLPPFVKTGQTIDVTISSLGDATSLKGGTLIATPLKGLDGQVYAIAQGAVSIGGAAARAGGGGRQSGGHATVGRIPNGATVEREVALPIAEKTKLTLSLNTPDFTTVTRMLGAVNGFLGGAYARAVDGGTVDIAVPEKYKHDVISLLAAVENLEVNPDLPARVVLDERTGTVVMGENIRIRELALSHGNLHLHIAAQPGEENPVARKTAEGREVALQAGATLGEIVRALNAVGVAPQEMIAIFQSIKASGSLQAELEII